MKSTLAAVVLAFPLCVKGATMNLTVAEPAGVARKGWPVASGVPFAKGALTDPGAVALFGPDGKEMPLQTEALAKWPDGSIRWLLLDFQVDLTAGEKRALRLHYGGDVSRAPIENPVRVARDGNAITVDTGPMKLLFYPGKSSPFGRVWLDGIGAGPQVADYADSLTHDLEPWATLVDATGRPHRMPHRSSGPDDPAAPAGAIVEQSGPMRVCIRMEGQHGRKENPFFRYVVRLHAFRGQPFVRMFYTFINDRQDAAMTKLRWLDLAFHMGNACGTWADGIYDGAREPEWNGETRRVFQVDETRHVVNGTHREGRSPGWAALGGGKAGIAVGLRHFWQNWPKSITVDVGTIRLGLCPELPKGLYDGKPIEEENKLFYQLRGGVHTFKVGVAKTHELWATFFVGKPDVGKLSSFFLAAEEPLLATCEPAYVSSTKAVGEVPPADPTKFAGYDAWLSRALDAHLARRDKDREYGMLNYGDWFGEREVNWGNLEYDLQHGLFIQYLRTGDRRFFLRAEQAARHHIDVDVVHATNPHLKNPWGRPPEAGDIWLHCLNHTGGYYDEKTSGLPVDRTYHMGHSTNYGHVWIAGNLDYYYLTGDRRAREVALMAADTMARHCPTAYNDHIRGLGWPIILVLAAYDATLDKKFLDAATRCWEVLKTNFDWDKGWVVRLAKGHCLHDDRRCYGNVPFMTGLTLCGLARYHRVTGNPEVLKVITLGIGQMIRECWMEDAKAFRYTPCPLTKPTPYVTLAAEAMAYDIAHTGNKEHLRILREGLRAVFAKSGADFGKGLAQLIHFTPHALAALEE